MSDERLPMSDFLGGCSRASERKVARYAKASSPLDVSDASNLVAADAEQLAIIVVDDSPPRNSDSLELVPKESTVSMQRGTARAPVRRRVQGQPSKCCDEIEALLAKLSAPRRCDFVTLELSEAQRAELDRHIRAKRAAPGALRTAAIVQESWSTEEAIEDRLRCLVASWKPPKTANDVIAQQLAAEQKRAEAQAEAEERKRRRELQLHRRLENQFRRSFARRKDLTTDEMMHGWRAAAS